MFVSLTRNQRNEFFIIFDKIYKIIQHNEQLSFIIFKFIIFSSQKILNNLLLFMFLIHLFINFFILYNFNHDVLKIFFNLILFK